ncbi:mitochondrial 37S ribosomal protein RSM19 [Pisolithus marmoratus]|nr:mitochondrial 37S ribosomal protein RSM19 [Pisolithus marmoratus]
MQPSLIVRSGRSAWKGPYFVAFPNLKQALEDNVPIRTQARSCTILPNFVGEGYRIRFMVHNGKDYIPVTVTQDMVGHKLGEFASYEEAVRLSDDQEQMTFSVLVHYL